MKIVQTKIFRTWLDKLSERWVRVKIVARIDQLRGGLYGDTAPVGQGVHELRIHIGPGYRIYYMHQGAAIVVLLSGGDKDSQKRDIAKAHKLARQWRTDHE